MKKFILLTAVCSLSLNMMAQDDDMYFVPTKENVAKEAESYGMPKSTYYSGSNRSVDDYNGRLSSSVTPVDSLGNEIETDDYQYTRRMTRFDDYSPSVAYWQGYRDGSWSSPWYFNRYYYSVYDPWFDPWYDTMYYYDSYYGWYSPWRYGWYYSSYYRPWGYYSWYTPIYYGGGSYRPVSHRRFHANRNVSGSTSFGHANNRNVRTSNTSFGNNRSSNSSGTFGNRSRTTTSNSNNNNSGFGSNRTTSSSSGFGSSRSSSSSSSSSNRSSGGGSFGGGSRSGGGGRFGR
jgi:hypothetical protein